ncbi:murein biosynthesis integral membrane protein MurJ [Rhodobacter calidifons]|uniref:Probable lipid II flippase MurJ n=1 Tax=Rhodobacter calidifons TaxID=2715277 RepID=A0ABX0G5J1_9RHOB|nr:murein biosynthesis integral membrane protein MurJ [Rhodobacter calidifons]NHB76051.1 murein biosynthesis integral membrane protein MurJ [Rhodobacter calidifons]
MSSSRGMIRNILTLGGWTLVSRGAGLVRELMMAAYLGAGPVADAFNVAFSLPNMFRRFFAEGAFNQAFVPLYSKKLEAGTDAEDFAQNAFSGLTVFLIVFTLIGTLAMPALVWAMAAGFVGDGRFDMAVDFGRITFCYIGFISLFALLSGILNAHGRFAEAGAVPVLMNLVFIAAMLLAHRMGWDMGLTLAWTTPITGIAQLAWTLYAARRIGFSPRLRLPRLTPDFRRMMVNMGPALLVGGVVQINLLVSRQVASGTEGAISWLVYADRLYQLPLGVVAIAVGTVLLPELSRRLQAGDSAGGREAFNRGTEFALLLTLPAAVALVVIALPITQVLYQRGAFGSEDTAATALALAIYGLGLPAFVLQKALQPLFYAREDTRSPFRYAVWSMILNAALAFGLMPWIGFSAAAWATTLSAWVMVGQLWWGARRLGEETRFDARFLSRLWRTAAASALMGAALWFGCSLLQPLLEAQAWRILALVLLIALGMASYAVAAFGLRAVRLSDLRALRRQR